MLVENGVTTLRTAAATSGCGDQVTHPQAGQAPCLGQGAQHNHVRAVAVPSQPVGHVRVGDELPVRLVEHHQHVGRHRVEERVQFGARSAVPVGLFGLQTRISRVRSVTAAAIAGRSWPWSARLGTRTLVAPVVAAMIG